MKKFWRIAYILMWVLLVAGAGVLVGFTTFEQYNRPCRRIYITMDYGKADKLVINQDIDSIIRRTTGRVSGKPVGWINIRQIEKSISQQAYVENVHIYESLDGNICVDDFRHRPKGGMMGQFALDQRAVAEQQELAVGMPCQRDGGPGNDHRCADIATHGV